MYNLLKLYDFIEINPRMKLEKGKEYQFVDMSIVVPGNRYVKAKIVKEFNGGGAKFQSGDTLFARITPCLENGKIAQFKAPERSIAFGSTEFFVFRNILEISDPGFVYYLAKSDLIRKPAEKSMAGASGRQRADIKSITNLEIPFPPFFIQQRISSILSAYDDLIENNTRRIQILEEMAQRIYTEWFVHFRFPGHEKVKMVDSELGRIPSGWEIRQLKDAAVNFDRMRKPLSKMQRQKMQGKYPYYGAAKVLDSVNDYIFDGRYLLMAEDGSVITPEGYPVLQFVDDKFWPNNHTHILQGTGKISTEFLYLALLNCPISGYITGAAQPKINQTNMNRIPIVMAKSDVHQQFQKIIGPLFDQWLLFERKNINLRKTRDLLLPKLISGEVDISELPDSEEVAAA